MLQRLMDDYTQVMMEWNRILVTETEEGMK